MIDMTSSPAAIIQLHRAWVTVPGNLLQLVGAAEAALCALIEPFYPKREWGAASAAEEPKVC